MITHTGYTWPPQLIPQLRPERGGRDTTDAEWLVYLNDRPQYPSFPLPPVAAAALFVHVQSENPRSRVEIRQQGAHRGE